MKTVIIAYSPKKEEVGTVREVSDDEAREMIRWGRARLFTAEEARLKAERDAAAAAAAEPAQADAAPQEPAAEPEPVTSVPDATAPRSRKK